jgi:glycosyltransferase involved in cell wall biosynthesis
MKIVSVMTGAGLGGAEFAAIELLDALIGRGHEALMLSDRPEIVRDTRVKFFPLDLGAKLSSRNYLAEAARLTATRRRLRTALEAQAPYDVLFLHYKKDELLAATLPRRLRPKLTWAEWGPIPRQMRSGPGNWAFRRAAAQAQTVMAVSPGTRDSLVEAGVAAAKVAVVPNALRVDELGFSPAGRERNRTQMRIPDDAFVVGCTSRFHPKKRLDVLVDAALALGNEVHLVLAGSGETEAALRARARPLGDRVHFLPTPGEHPNELFSAFDLCAFCPGPTEGSPTSVILGMLAGRTCVATAAEGVVGLLGDGVGTIATPANDPRTTGACIEEYVVDPERARREGDAAAERARARFAAPTVAALAERLLDRAPGG